MSVSRGKIHDYLGMNLDYTFRGQVRVAMISYIEEILYVFKNSDSKWGGTKSSTAPNNISVVIYYSNKLSQNKVVEFQNLVAKTLYDTKQEIPNTCAAISFLTTRIRVTEKDDWDKLLHLM